MHRSMMWFLQRLPERMRERSSDSTELLKNVSPDPHAPFETVLTA